MLQHIYLTILVGVAALDIINNEGLVEAKNKFPDIVSRRINSEQHVFKFNQFHKNGADVAGSEDFPQNVKPNSIPCIVKNNVANCSTLQISDLNQLNVSSNIIGLDISFNIIQFIPNGALVSFTRLEWLNISHNKIQQLSSGSFRNLTALTKLYIQGNNLTMDSEKFPADVFKPLVNLQQLWMHNNTRVHHHENLTYPDNALAQLHNVVDLRLDGLPNKTFDSGFQNMTSLTNLTLEGSTEGYCNMRTLNQNMFQYLQRLTHLALINCNISGSDVHAEVFLHLTNLTYLDLSKNDYLGLEYLSAALTTIRNFTKLKVLNISNIINPYSPGVTVTYNFSISLPPTLEVLYAKCNAFQKLEDGVLQSLPKSLTELDVGCNKFAFLHYLKDLDQLENLNILILSGGDIFILPYYYPPDPQTIGSKLFKISNIFNYAKHLYVNQSLPPKLKELYINNAGWSNLLTKFQFNQNNTLSSLILESNNFPTLEGPITGLNVLEKLSLFGCRIKQIYPTFFQDLTSLKVLNLSTNYFGRFSFYGRQSIFSQLKNLTTLDLSFTDIRHISNTTFIGLDNLENLYLQINPIFQFNVDISNMTNLKYINLSMGSLTELPPNMTNMLDTISKTSPNLTIDLTGNPIECFCSKIEFLKWMITTTVLPKTMTITCSFEDGTRRDYTVSNLEKLYEKRARECASNFELFSVVISATFILVIAIGGVIIYNFRWKLRYLYYSAVLHYNTDKTNSDTKTFEYDVFVSYAHEDHDFVVNTLYPQLESNGLKIHIHGLHFIAGALIASNVVNAVSSSRHTLAVLTQHFMNSKWSKYEVEMANMEQVHTGRSVLIFLFKDDLPKLPTQLLFHIKNNTYIRFPKPQCSPMEMRGFWSKLVSDLKA